MNASEFLTPATAAKQAGVSRSLIYAWIKEKRLACFRVGSAGRRGRILIAPGDLDEVIRECRHERHPLLALE